MGQSDVNETVPKSGAEVCDGQRGEIDRDGRCLERFHLVHHLDSEKREEVADKAAQNHNECSSQSEIVVDLFGRTIAKLFFAIFF